MKSGSSNDASSGAARVVMAVFFGASALFLLGFVAMGALTFYFTTYDPLRGWWAARAWRETSCRVEASEIETEDHDDGKVARVAILYSYQVGERTYQGNRVDFGLRAWSNDFTAHRQVVASHPPGSRTTCFVDPNHPEQSVLSRTLDRSLLITGGISLVFGGAGLGGLLLVAAVVRWKFARRPGGPVSTRGAGRFEPAGSVAAGAVRLTPEASRVAWLLPLVLAGFWNFFVVVMMVTTLATASGTADRALMLLFYVPFLLVGLGLAYWAGREVLKTLGPRPALRLEREPRLGDRVTLHWSIEGPVWMLSRLGIRIEGLERAKYTRGTDHLTDERVFFTKELLAAARPQPLDGGSVSLTVPAGTMPTFIAPHNSIVWRVVVVSAIPRWPDLDERFVFVVHPRVPEAR